MSHPNAQPKKSAAPRGKPAMSTQAIEMIAAVARIEERTNHVAARMDGLDERMDKVVDALDRVARVEERQISVRALLEEHMESEEEDLRATRSRLEGIERKIPALMETRKWIVSGVIGILAMVGMTAWDTMFHNGRQPAAAQAVKSAVQAIQPERPAE